LLALLLAGCAGADVFRGSPSTGGPAVVPDGEAAYRVGCADVLEVAFADRPGWDCLASVGLDGRLPLGEPGSPAVEGATADEVRAAVAGLVGVDPGRVRVRLADARAGRVYVSGPEAGQLRAVPYRGPEPTVAFLWRVGAMKQGCTDLRHVTVTRTNVAEGGPPQVFKVDVEAVVLDGDNRTDVVLRPSDQVTVGETLRSRFGRLLPTWLRPLYRKVVGLLPPDGWPWAGR
jgi:protein involved in polysaccharide export with SLBB domain